MSIRDLTKRTFIEECAGCGHWFLSDRSTDSCQCPKCKRLKGRENMVAHDPSSCLPEREICGHPCNEYLEHNHCPCTRS